MSHSTTNEPIQKQVEGAIAELTVSARATPRAHELAIDMLLKKDELSGELEHDLGIGESETKGRSRIPAVLLGLMDHLRRDAPRVKGRLSLREEMVKLHREKMLLHNELRKDADAARLLLVETGLMLETVEWICAVPYGGGIALDAHPVKVWKITVLGEEARQKMIDGEVRG